MADKQTSPRKKRPKATKAAEPVHVEESIEEVEDLQPEMDDDVQLPVNPNRISTHSSMGPADEYLIQTFFDKTNKQFVARVVEFPEIRATAPTRESAIEEVVTQIENFVIQAERRKEPIPEPLQSKKYPDQLKLPISQSLYRRLDLISRTERVNIETLVTEILTQGLERRYEKRGGQQQQPQQNRQHHQQQRGGGGHHGGHRQQRGRGYQQNLENRENFLEYVRNLEKGGGTPGGRWKK